MNKQAHAVLAKPKIKKTNSRATELLKQLESLKKESVQIKIDTSKLSSRHSQKFKSEIRNLKMAEIQKRVTAPTASGEMGDPGADALSKYMGEVYVKILRIGRILWGVEMAGCKFPFPFSRRVTLRCRKF